MFIKLLEYKFFSSLVALFLSGILIYLGFLSESYFVITLISFILMIIFIYYMFQASKEICSYFAMTVLAYTIFTQFGLCFVYYVLTKDIIIGYGGEMYHWLSSPYYPMVLGLGLIAVSMLMFGSLMGTHIKILFFRFNSAHSSSEIRKKVTAVIGLVFLLFAFLYFAYFWAIGAFSIKTDYTDMHSNVVMTGPLWELVIILYGFGLCCITCCAEGKKLFIGVALYLATATILLLIGNRGEVLFPVLACMGAYFYKNNKIDRKIIYLGVIIVLVVVPVVKIFRHLGNGNLLQLYLASSPISGIAEMGVSMRMTNYIISELNDGSRKLLYGFSYYNPIVNIMDHLIPGDIRLTPPDSFNFRNSFYLWKAMTPVAESYANFGIIGVIIHHFIMGFILGSAESEKPEGNRLTLLTCIAFVFIYSTRNVFASVPIYCLASIGLYLVIELLSKILESGNTGMQYEEETLFK